MRPGYTKATTMTANDWARLASLYNPDGGNDIYDGAAQASGWLVTGADYNWEFAISETTPTFKGHPMSAGDSLNGQHRDYIRKLWVKNGTAGSNVTFVMTPQFSL